MQYLQITLVNDRFNIDDMLSIVSNKTYKDFKQTDIYKAIIDSDNDAIMEGMCKKEYFNSILYWSCPKIAFLIENGKPWKHAKEECIKNEGKGLIYLVKIGENLYKYGRTKNMRKRLSGYPRGSVLLRNDYVNDMINAEKILLNAAKESNGRLFQGNEYYYYENNEEPTEVHNLALKRITTLGI